MHPAAMHRSRADQVREHRQISGAVFVSVERRGCVNPAPYQPLPPSMMAWLPGLCVLLGAAAACSLKPFYIQFLFGPSTCRYDTGIGRVRDLRPTCDRAVSLYSTTVHQDIISYSRRTVRAMAQQYGTLKL